MNVYGVRNMGWILIYKYKVIISLICFVVRDLFRRFYRYLYSYREINGFGFSCRNEK